MTIAIPDDGRTTNGTTWMNRHSRRNREVNSGRRCGSLPWEEIFGLGPEVPHSGLPRWEAKGAFYDVSLNSLSGFEPVASAEPFPPSGAPVWYSTGSPTVDTGQPGANRQPLNCLAEPVADGNCAALAMRGTTGRPDLAGSAARREITVRLSPEHDQRVGGGPGRYRPPGRETVAASEAGIHLVRKPPGRPAEGARRPFPSTNLAAH